MKNNEIITIKTIETTLPTLKDERLAKATQRIMAIYADAAKYASAKNREISKILADVADKKSYEADGFTSVADYAYKIFGIARQNAYSLANAGKIYNDKDSHPELLAMSPSKLAELATVEPTIINAALNDGTISHNSTQRDLREFANATKDHPDEPVVLDRYTAIPFFPVPEDQQELMSSPRTMDEWDEYFTEYLANITGLKSHIEIINLPKGRVTPDVEKATVPRHLYVNVYGSIVVSFYKYAVRKSRNNTAKHILTREELLAMLKDMDDGEK